jgi:hypothetical protein
MHLDFSFISSTLLYLSQFYRIFVAIVLNLNVFPQTFLASLHFTESLFLMFPSCLSNLGSLRSFDQ